MIRSVLIYRPNVLLRICPLRIDMKLQIKRMVVEMYDATKEVRKSKMAKMKEFSPLPWLHINVDLWTSRTSGEKYIGENHTSIFLFVWGRDFFHLCTNPNRLSSTSEAYITARKVLGGTWYGVFFLLLWVLFFNQ